MSGRNAGLGEETPAPTPAQHCYRRTTTTASLLVTPVGGASDRVWMEFYRASVHGRRHEPGNPS